MASSERYCACGCWQEFVFEGGELEELSAHVCTYHMAKLSEYLDNLGIDKAPTGQYTLSLERPSGSEESHANRHIYGPEVDRTGWSTYHSRVDRSSLQQGPDF